ncbi:hypothetical protein SAPIO_CDS10063 [Scedosporium apiospermum]|uniref:Uncharacterized protein n=1 Tax=Pseudallescheria apiosperma TaxID=563466 RepID=A0A084FWA3_PSEDA|nr:uncharacterized protein SAPIO_CDS10063 [Scedosporium apiospermum]KEZ39365.1 hypothetical protein SAPIO_CDS10063 [Scedosporium apiospermum]
MPACPPKNVRADRTSKRDLNKTRREIMALTVKPAPLLDFRKALPVDEWELLPPLPEIIEAVNTFTRHYFQLGFGSGVKAAEIFMERAEQLALSKIYDQPSLESCQAFYLLSIAQQGSQDNLHSGPISPVSLSASDITTLLPSDEESFATGREPESRAALEDTPPAHDNPSLLADPNRSLFASLIQIHYYWGSIARRAVNRRKSSQQPWDPRSEFTTMATKRKPKICIIHIDSTKDSARQAYFSEMSLQLFSNVRDLYAQINAQFTLRTPDESVGAQMASFCVYSCGLFSAYLVKYPRICPDPAISRMGPEMLQRAMSILVECKEVWPLASRWLEALEKSSRDPKGSSFGLEGSMADGSQSGGGSLSLILETGPATPKSTTQDMYDPTGAYYSPATTTLGPGNDGFEGELQFYIDGAQAWPGSSALFDYS